MLQWSKRKAFTVNSFNFNKFQWMAPLQRYQFINRGRLRLFFYFLPVKLLVKQLLRFGDEQGRGKNIKQTRSMGDIDEPT